jgi:hypothetical protein
MDARIAPAIQAAKVFHEIIRSEARDSSTKRRLIIVYTLQEVLNAATEGVYTTRPVANADTLRPSVSRQHATIFHTTRTTTIGLFNIAHRGLVRQSDDSGRIGGYSTGTENFRTERLDECLEAIV